MVAAYLVSVSTFGPPRVKTSKGKPGPRGGRRADRLDGRAGLETIAWIATVADEDASPALRTCLDRARAPNGTVDNVMRVHSLRPHTMLGHVALYQSVLHDDGNSVPTWFQETVGSYTSMLNDCPYSLANHWANARHLIGDEARAEAIHRALAADRPEQAFEGKELALLRYTRKLTRTPGEMVEDDVAALKRAGADDGEILEVNQICGYFNYVNRCLNGLGVTLKGDMVGYYTSGDGAGGTEGGS